MARTWLKVEPAVVQHPKTARLAALLSVTPHAAVGILIELWGYCQEFQGDGDVTSCPQDVLRRVLGTSADNPIEVLQKCGFVDADGKLHDWDEYAGALVERRRKEAARKRLERKQRRQDIRRTSAGPSAGRPQRVRGQSLESRVESRVSSLPPGGFSTPAANDTVEILNGNLPPEYLAPLEGYLRSAQHPESVLATIRACGPGGIDEQLGVSWGDVGKAILEMSATPGEFAPARLRAYIRRLKQPDRPPRPPEGPRYADGPRSAPQPTKLYLTADELDVRAGIPLVPRVAP